MKERNEETTKEKGIMKNQINAVRFIESMMNMGYANCDAICDIIDNSIDAKATKVKILIEKNNEEPMKIMIVDNGIGMYAETLMQAFRFGSETQHEENSDLGKFGMGLSTAGLSLAEKTTILTKTQDGQILKGWTDVDEIRRVNDLVVSFPKEIENEDVELFNSQLGDQKSGTIIILEKCTGVKYKNSNSLVSALIKEASRIYRKYLDKVHIWVNDKEVTANDWLFEGDSRTKIIADETYDIKLKNKKGEEENGCIR